MPATKDYELSYCDMIFEKAKQSATTQLDRVVETATVFISHAWKYKFLDVLDALEDHFKDEPDKIIWFDLVSNNQQKATGLSYEWWATTFKDAIEQLGHTVTIMAPWNDPIPYKRKWCIFEIYCTVISGAKFEIAMSNNEHRAFIEECKHGSTDVINKMLSIVNAEKRESWNPMDKERIHSVIKNEVGFASSLSNTAHQTRLDQLHGHDLNRGCYFRRSKVLKTFLSIAINPKSFNCYDLSLLRKLKFEDACRANLTKVPA